jgi:hypothetical protein
MAVTFCLEIPVEERRASFMLAIVHQFDGDVAAAVQWLTTSQKALGRKPPF